MADQDDAGALGLALGQQVQHLGLDRDIQGRGGLIGHHQGRVQGDGRGDQRTLAQSAGELVRTLTGAQLGFRDTHLLQQLDHPAVPFGGIADPMQAQGLGDLLAHGAQRVQGHQGILQDEAHVHPADAPPLAVGEAGDIPSVHLEPLGLYAGAAPGEPDQGAGAD